MAAVTEVGRASSPQRDADDVENDANVDDDAAAATGADDADCVDVKKKKNKKKKNKKNVQQQVASNGAQVDASNPESVSGPDHVDGDKEALEAKEADQPEGNQRLFLPENLLVVLFSRQYFIF